ncbi:brassinosteroid-responsive RING protein 1-like [Zingiber officinale]|uniref:RING-type domain-containing protein n=1 Tax=Zingiber officinale TaxID=94328 RepID=A0A8J5HDA9_ZINOF|nr:brassinosteroid-responsive RING protein 1-like [Zingiber officinale]KAG6521636.1 hypothetical protein ZIOFF_018761 [Zingiber officinale]
MRFHCDMYDAVPKPIVLFFLYLGYLRFSALVVLHFLGLYSSSEPIIYPWEEHEFYFLDDNDAAARDSPPMSKLVPASPLQIKRQLRVVEFGSLGWRSHVDEDNEPTCVICLGNLAAQDKVRKLANCTHGFHVECIDRWVDAGQARCPLCRADLLPAKEDDKWRSFLGRQR